MKLPAALPVFLLLFAGCSSIQTHRFPAVDLTKFKQFYVEHRLTDDHHVDEAIVAELKNLGRNASAGPLTMMPDEAEVVVTYQDDWTWDFKSYLIQLDVQMREARMGRPLATGSYRQPSMVTKPPAEVVRTILTRLFESPSTGRKKAPSQASTKPPKKSA